MVKELKTIKEMIDSSDIESKYLAVTILRSNKLIVSEKERNRLIKKVNIIDRIKTIEDIYEELGIEEKDVLIFKDPKNSFEKYINACTIIPQIVKVYNEDWIIDFNNSDQYKYFPYFKKVGLVWSVDDAGWSTAITHGPSGFYYKNKELLMDSCTKFKAVYNDWLT